MRATGVQKKVRLKLMMNDFMQDNKELNGCSFEKNYRISVPVLAARI